MTERPQSDYHEELLKHPDGRLVTGAAVTREVQLYHRAAEIAGGFEVSVIAGPGERFLKRNVAYKSDYSGIYFVAEEQEVPADRTAVAITRTEGTGDHTPFWRELRTLRGEPRNMPNDPRKPRPRSF